MAMLSCAIGSNTKINNFRLGYIPAAMVPIRAARVTILLAGTVINGYMRANSASIKDAINNAPNSCTMRLNKGAAPSVGQDLQVRLNSDTPNTIFAGVIQSVVTSYDAQPVNWTYSITAIDYMALANRRLPFGTWTNISATTIALSLIASYAPTFNTTYVQASLPNISITLDGSITLSAAFAQIAKLIGGYFYWDEMLGLHLFTAESTSPPDLVDASHTNTMIGPAISMTVDTSQVRTRVYGKGKGEAILSDIAAGETILPINNSIWFNAAGGSVIVGSQVLTYTGKSQASPTTAPVAAAAVGAGIDLGDHTWAYTFVTAAGETLPSLVSAVLTALIHTPAAPAVAPTCVTYPAVNFFGSGPGTTVGGSYVFQAQCIGQGYSVVSANSAAIIAVASTNNPTIIAPIYVTVVVPNDVYINQVQLYASVNGGAFAPAGFYGVGINGGNQIQYVGNVGGAAYIGAVSTTLARANLSGIAVGPVGTTSRQVYRTPLGSTQMKLQQSIANNTATVGVTDSTADASLGANAPTSDTSGLVLMAVSTTSGATAAGATVMNLASAAAFLTTGGWVIVAGIPVRYTTKSGNQLQGIPAIGAGVISAAIPSGTTVSTTSMITGIPSSGVGSIATAVTKGTTVNVWVQRDDATAQAAMAVLEGGDGIHEYYISNDNIESALITACDASLALFKSPIITIVYPTRDTKSKSGKPVTIITTDPPINAVLVIQDVSITEIDISPSGLLPKFTVTASSVRYSLEDIIRQLAAGII